jgi:2-amino-4-hydroxy-6-hydroxymethyldihydropteridine diphosphokinase
VAFLALGSNIEPEKNILEAVRLLSTHVKILKTSTVYLTEPLLRKSQPKYYNCVLKTETDIEPEKLKFDVLRVIENKLGRQRGPDKYASRTIDIDLILFGNLQLSTKELVIPDPEIGKRAFLAISLCELAPKLLLPGTDKTFRDIANRFRNHEIARLTDFTKTLRSFIRRLSK